MPRLLACPSCRRHVQATERDCPFCGYVGLTTGAGASRLSAMLLGLCLAGCASTGSDDAGKTDAKGDKADEPQPEPAQPEEPAQPDDVKPTDTAAPVDPDPTGADPNGPEPEPNDTAIADPQPQPENVGTDAGDEIDDAPKPIVTTPQKTKYGGPRPAKKYGAPPKPGPEDPW